MTNVKKILMKAVAVEISAENIEQLRNYSEVTGVSQRRVVNEALEVFFEKVAPARLKAFGNSPKK